MEEIDWVVPGAKVAVVCRGQVAVCTVARLTTTQVILEGSKIRFRRGNLTDIAPRDPWREPSTIMRLTDDYVIHCRMRQLIGSLPAHIQKSTTSVRSGYRASLEEMDADLNGVAELIGKAMRKAEKIKRGEA